MSFVGDIFHGIGNLLSGHSWGSDGAQPQDPATTIQMPKTPAPQQQAPTKPTSSAGGSPSFLAAAALPNYGAQVGAQSNPGGKTLVGQ